MLRKHGVVGKFVEFFGPGALGIPLADRATIANMAPEYGATCGFFPGRRRDPPVPAATGRKADRVALVEAYAKAQGLWHDDDREPRLLRHTSSWISRPSSPRSPAPSARRIACR